MALANPVDQFIKAAEADPALAARLVWELSHQPKPDDPFPVPMFPPLEWIQADAIPDGIEPMKATITPEGQVYGYFFEWDTCIAGSGVYSECWTAPPSPTGYNLFHQSDHVVLDAAGMEVTVKAGLIVPGHADPNESEESQREHYDDPRNAAVIVRAYENHIGGYIVGSVRPGATWEQVTLARNAPLSGHWNYQARDAQTAYWDCIGPVMVVRPGLALNRGRSMTAALRVVRRDDSGQPVEVKGELVMQTDIEETVEVDGGGGPAVTAACSCEPVETVTAAVDPITGEETSDDSGVGRGLAEQVGAIGADMERLMAEVAVIQTTLADHGQTLAELVAAGIEVDPTTELDNPNITE